MERKLNQENQEKNLQKVQRKTEQLKL